MSTKNTTTPEERRTPPTTTDVCDVVTDSHEERRTPLPDSGLCDVVQVGDPAAAALAGEQSGVIDRNQLRGTGLGRGAIDYRLARGRLHRFHRGVYLVGHAVAPEHAPLRAAVLAGGKRAYVSSRSALEVYGAVEKRDGPIHITVTSGCRRPRKGLLVHRTRRPDPRDFGVLDGTLPITSPARALLDFAEAANPRELEWAVNEAFIQKLVTREELLAIIERTPGRRGARPLKLILARHEGTHRTNPGGERLLLAGLRAAHIKGYATNAVVHGKEVDFFFEDAGLVVEVDSALYHGTPTATNRDRRKDAFFRSRGLTVLRYSFEQVDEEIPFVIAEIAAHLGPPERA